MGFAARILINNAMKTARNPDELLAALARSIDNEQKHLEFLEAAKRAFGSH